MDKNEYNGYSLFNDVEDKTLQQRNRAVVMANIAEQYTQAKKITLKGTALILGYFGCIPQEERKPLYEVFEKTMKERNYVTT